MIWMSYWFDCFLCLHIVLGLLPSGNSPDSNHLMTMMIDTPDLMGSNGHFNGVDTPAPSELMTRLNDDNAEAEVKKKPIKQQQQ